MKYREPYLPQALLFVIVMMILSVFVQAVWAPEARSEKQSYKTESIRTDKPNEYKNIERGGRNERDILLAHPDGKNYKITYRDGWTQSVKWE